jgi:hypothetical protein
MKKTISHKKTNTPDYGRLIRGANWAMDAGKINAGAIVDNHGHQGHGVIPALIRLTRLKFVRRSALRMHSVPIALINALVHAGLDL